MLSIPNINNIRDFVKAIDSEYDIQARVQRYTNLPELVSKATEHSLTNEKDAIRALFVADYLVPASEFPSGTTDDERYSSIFNSFKIGLEHGFTSDSIMRVFYLSYKTATAIRRQDLFMGGRGLDTESRLIRINDNYIIAYLEVAAETLRNKTSCGWELGVLAAALMRDFPDKQILKYKNTPNRQNKKELLPLIWEILNSYEKTINVETNMNAVIPNIDKSKAILALDAASKASYLSLWNFSTPDNLSKFRVEIQAIDQAFKKKLDGKSLISLKCQKKTQEHFFVIRDPTLPNRPTFFLESPSDEINLSILFKMLNARGKESGEEWKEIFQKTEFVEDDKTKVIEKKSINAPQERVQTLKVGFFKKIKMKIFGKKKEKQTSPKNVLAPVTHTKQKRRVPPYIQKSTFLAKSLTVDAVGDLALYEEFDTLRESNYTILGIFERDNRTREIKFLINPSKPIAKEIIDYYYRIERDIEKFYRIFGEEEISLEEIFWLNENNEEKLIVCLAENESRTIGTVATSKLDKILDLQARTQRKDPLQRRSIHMRTKQLLGAIDARIHPDFKEIVERIYHDDFDTQNADFLTIK
ncbi:MAG: hypothetical protein ACTSW1_13465 [Candidatus Hodarchaeales archaeon]